MQKAMRAWGKRSCTFETLTCVRSTNVSSNMSPGDGSPLSRVSNPRQPQPQISCHSLQSHPHTSERLQVKKLPFVHMWLDQLLRLIDINPSPRAYIASSRTR